MHLSRAWCALAVALLAGCSSSSTTDGAAGSEIGTDRSPLIDQGPRLESSRRDVTKKPASWTSLKNAPSVRYHTATMLQDGSVLIVGGEQELTEGNVKLVTDTWVYRPSNDSFTVAGKITVGRTGHTATLLADGRVLLVGGNADAWTYLDSAVIFDPAKSVDPWLPTAPLPAVRGKHAALKLADDRVAVIGGSGTSGGTPVDYASIAIFDPNAGTWSTPALSSLKQKRYYHTATLLKNNKVLVAGGVQSGTELTWLDTLEIWDPVSGTVTASAAKLTQPRAYHTAHLLPDSRVLMLGGRCGTASGLCTLDSDQLYDTSVDKIIEVAHQGAVPAGHASAALFDGRVFIGGSWDSSGSATALIFSSTDTSWRALPDIPHPRGSHTASALGDGSVLLVGGEDPQAALTLDIAERLYNP
jgi:hypothetical protein